MEWFVGFFDELYYETYSVFETEERNEREASFIASALGLPKGARLLDLGCGYARHAVYLARWGYRVTCFDLSEYLLEKARERVERFQAGDRVELVRGDMRRLEYESECDGVYMFFTTFGDFSDEENLDVLRRVSRALRPGGVFLVDQSNPIAVMHSAYLHGGSMRVWYEAGDYLVLEEMVYDIDEGRVRTRRTFLKGDPPQLVAEREFSLRLYMPWELRAALEAAGLRVERLYGSYRGGEYKPDSPRLIALARKPASTRGAGPEAGRG